MNVGFPYLAINDFIAIAIQCVPLVIDKGRLQCDHGQDVQHSKNGS